MSIVILTMRHLLGGFFFDTAARCPERAIKVNTFMIDLSVRYRYNIIDQLVNNCKADGT